MIRTIRTHLAWKVFLSYVAVILVGVVVLATAASFSAPAAFERNLASMGAMMSGGMMGNAQTAEANLYSGYQMSVTEALSLAALAALIAAIAASYLVSRQVVGPIQKMVGISHRIAEGEFHERLEVSGSLARDQLDELDLLALSFNQMADKLEKTEVVRRQLIGDISHELRTPLTAIKGYMEGLIDGIIPASGETFQQVHSEVDRLQRLVNDLQELSRMEAGAYQVNLKSVPVLKLVENLESRLSRQFEEKGILLVAAVPTGLPNVLADEDRILQVLINLTGNAMQYTPAGGKVTISALCEKNEVRITVADTGIGIAPEHLPHIFTRFYRVDKSRTRASGGSGIGLTIAQSLIKAHHGRIWVESAGEGKGSAFHFTLPVSADK
ncbi:MAG TPA: ATP-binding protein [Anaerolineaceae bacterium]